MTGRKTREVTITAEGRDKGKVFLITEMSAVAGEKWAIRTILAMAKSGINIPPELMKAGWAGLALVGFQGIFTLDFRDAEPLLDEMMACVQIKEPAITRALLPEDIQEVATIFKLRVEVFELHTGFSIPGVASIWGTAAGTEADKPKRSTSRRR